MQRTYNIRASVAPSLPQPQPRAINGSFSFGAFNAAQDYAAKMLPGYEAMPGGRVESPYLWRFEAINHTDQLGAVIWVREL